MFNVIRLKAGDGEEYILFTGCTETGFSAKDVVTMPGAYEECAGATDGSEMKFRSLEGSIGPYHTKLYAMCVEDKTLVVNDITGNVANMLTTPAVAANAMIKAMSEEVRDSIRGAIDAVHFYETLNEHSNVSLPDQALSELSEEVATTMRSAQQHYVLLDTENQQIFQKSFDSEFGVILPSIQELHGVQDVNYSPMDIVRSLMPYRRPGNPSTYEVIYHTPYFRVGMNANLIPRHLEWMYGFDSNNLLDIQPNERHMQKNLHTLYCADVATNIAAMVTGVMFGTDYGSRFERLRKTRDRDIIDRIISELQAGASHGEGTPAIYCDISTSEVDALWDAGWDADDVARALKEHLHMDKGFLEHIVQNTHPARRVISTDNQWFTLDITGEQCQYFTDQMIKMGYISYAMDRFFSRLCQCAYQACWGHSGVTRAIPILVSQANLANNDKKFSSLLSSYEAGKNPYDEAFASLYSGSYGAKLVGSSQGLDDDFGGSVLFGDDGEGDETEGIEFDYYLTRQSYANLASGSADMNTIMNRRDNETESERLARLNALGSEAKIVERWQAIDGQSNLDYFITTAFAQTADVDIYIQSFIKLCRWGDRRPKMLVFHNHPEIRHVFDLGLGTETINTDIVNEDDLVKVNGCDYSFVGFLNTTTNRTVDSKFIIGFILQKDYGTVQRQYLASWDDLAEMVTQNTINIGDFKVAAPVDASNLVGVETFEKRTYEIYESDSNVSEGIKIKQRGRELSTMVLLPHPAITQERAYLKSLINKTVENLRDRQYDNLNRYIQRVQAFYGTYGPQLSNIHTTMDLQELATLYAELAKNGPAQKADANAAAAANAMKKLSLGGDAPAVEYDSRELKGKFVLVDDPTNLAVVDDAWEPIKFSDPRLRQLNPSAKHSIVLLMMKCADCWVLCRKDAKFEELDLERTGTGTRPRWAPYSEIRKVVRALPLGKDPKFQGLPFKMHESLRM